MAYCTQTDIVKVLPLENLVELTDDDDIGVVDTVKLDEAIELADGEINAYLTRYSLPLASVPDILRKLSADIAIYNLYSRRMEAIPETREERYKNAVRMLEKINKGEISLGTSDDDLPEPSTEGSVRWYAV